MADKASSKADALRAMREANYSARNTPEASGTGRKPPSGKVVSAPVPMAKPSRNSVRASPNPVAKATKAKPAKADDVPSSDRVVSRLGAGRTAQDSPRSETAGAVAIRKPGRPRDPSAASRATLYRRQAEKAK